MKHRCQVFSPSIFVRIRDNLLFSFISSARTFDLIWRTVADNLPNYRTYPRVIGGAYRLVEDCLRLHLFQSQTNATSLCFRLLITPECGGKNYHWLHNSAEVDNAVYATIRSAFEFQVRLHLALNGPHCGQGVWLLSCNIPSTLHFCDSPLGPKMLSVLSCLRAKEHLGRGKKDERHNPNGS